jgi:hypothetical protein
MKRLAFLLIAICFSPIIVFAQTSHEPIGIKVPTGEFLFRNLSLTHPKYGDPELTGEVVNNTNKEWMTVEFQLEAIGADGKKIGSAIRTINRIRFVNFSPGGVQNIESAYLHFADIDTPVVTDFDIGFVEGVYPATYTFSMLKPAPNKDLLFQDGFIDAAFVVTKKQIAFGIWNKTDNPIKLDWNQVSFIDINGDSHKVIHEGVKYMDKNNSMPPSVIPPTAKLKDIVFPTDYISYSAGQYGGWREKALFPDGSAATDYEGKTIGVFIPLEINGTVKNYLFTFRIDKVEA